MAGVEDIRWRAWLMKAGAPSALLFGAFLAGLVFTLCAYDALLRGLEVLSFLRSRPQRPQWLAALRCLGWTTLGFTLAAGGAAMMFTDRISPVVDWRARALLGIVLGSFVLLVRVCGNQEKRKAGMKSRFRRGKPSYEMIDGLSVRWPWLKTLFEPVKRGSSITWALILACSTQTGALLPTAVHGTPSTAKYAIDVATDVVHELSAPAAQAAPDSGDVSARLENRNRSGRTQSAAPPAAGFRVPPPAEPPHALVTVCGQLEDLEKQFAAGPVPEAAANELFTDWKQLGGAAAGCPRGQAYLVGHTWVMELHQEKTVAGDGRAPSRFLNAVVVSDSAGRGAVVPAEAVTVLRRLLPSLLRVEDRADFAGGRYLVVRLRGRGCGLFVKDFRRPPYRWVPPKLANMAVPRALRHGGVPYLPADPTPLPDGTVRYLLGVTGVASEPDLLEVAASDGLLPRVVAVNGAPPPTLADWCDDVDRLNQTAAATGDP